MNKKLNFQIIITLLSRVSVIVLIILGIVDSKVLAQLPWKLIVLTFSGLISGSYYGWYNDSIWNPPRINSKDKIEENRDFDNEKELPLYKGHQLWIHLVCGLAGSLALYIFLKRISSLEQNLGWEEFILIVIALLGYTGLLPRTLWFFANRGGDTKV